MGLIFEHRGRGVGSFIDNPRVLKFEPQSNFGYKPQGQMYRSNGNK